MVYKIKQNDYGGYVRTRIEDENGVPNLTGADLRFLMKQDGGPKIVAGAAELDPDFDPEDPKSPNLRHKWVDPELDTAAFFRAEWEVTFAPGTASERQETFPSGGYDEVLVYADLG